MQQLVWNVLFWSLLVSAHSAWLMADEPISIGSRRELFVDRFLIDQISGDLQQQLHHPVPREIVLSHDESWEGTGCGYHSIFQDGELYRMYYKAWHLQTHDDRVSPGDHSFSCYAESKDGLHWTKPNLGLVEFQGSSQNNILLEPKAHGSAFIDPAHVSFFKDENPHCPPEAQYKAFILARKPKQFPGDGLVPFQSADGLHWEIMSEKPVITEGAFDSQNLAFWDPVRNEYRAYWRFFQKGIGKGSASDPTNIRDIMTATSPDFLNWSTPVRLNYPGSLPEQLYVNQIKPYHRAPHLLIGFPVRYTEREWNSSMSQLPDREHRQKRANTNQRYGTALTESLLMSSRDGETFKRWNEAFLRPGIQRPGTWSYGQQYIGWHLVETPSDLPGAPPELSLYATENYWIGQGDKLRRYTLRLDGFVSLNAPLSGGSMTSKPLIFAGNQLSVNFSSSAAGQVKVELQTPAGQPIPGYSLEDCEETFGDEVNRTIYWKNGPDVSKLAGQPLRIKFWLQDADLYSFQFVSQ